MIRTLQKLLLYAFFFSINFEMWDPFDTGGSFSIAKLIGFFYLAAMIPSVLEFRTPSRVQKTLWPILLFFTVLTTVSIFNISVGQTDFFDMSIFQNIVLIWILANHENLENMVMERALLYFAIGNIVLSFLFYIGIGVEYDVSEDRSTIFGANENNVGIHMSISLIILMVTIIHNRLKLNMARFLLIPGVVVIFLSMIATGSRVSFIAFILATAIFLLFFKTKLRWAKPVLILFFLSAGFYIWQTFLVDEGITNRLLLSIQEGDLSNRLGIWRWVYPVWLESPLWGVGSTGYLDFVFTEANKYISPHNVILEILCLTGIAGLVLYLLFFTRLFNIGLQIFRDKNYLLPLLLFVPICGMILSAQILNVKIAWAIYAYILANSLYVAKSNAQNNILL
ncbi:MAG: O-antigen ligase family protein [Bacteroidales bacterium]|nr:O-antigen ligase family protein [Bacteroidales bacterium]